MSAEKTFGVRLNAEATAALEQEALRRGIKPTSAARDLILEALTGAGSRTAESRLGEIQSLLERLERELAERVVLALSQAVPQEHVDGKPPGDFRQEASGLSLADYIKAP